MNQYITTQIRNAKNEYRKKGRVEPATVSSLYAEEAWESLLSRYLRYKLYIEEIKPSWNTVQIIYYADGSAVSYQQSIFNERREVFELFPSGDVCF
jgi:hypothetical protein